MTGLWLFVTPALHSCVSPKLCSLLVAGTYTWGGMCSLTITCSPLELSFCGSNVIYHFGCEYSASSLPLALTLTSVI